MLGKLGAAGIGLNDIAPVGDQGTIFDYPTDPIEVAKAKEVEIAKAVELARIKRLFKVQIPGMHDSIHPKVAALKKNKILDHILVSKHNFDRILVNPKCEEGLRRLLSFVMDHGSLKHYLGDTYIKSLCIAGEMIEIKGVIDLAGELEIGTAWIT